jgi:hypothetical protein
MEYESGEKPQVGDSVLGNIEGGATAGKVSRVDEKKGRFVLARRSASVFDSRSKQMTPGPMEYVEGQPEQFKLMYRKGG